MISYLLYYWLDKKQHTSVKKKLKKIVVSKLMFTFADEKKRTIFFVI